MKILVTGGSGFIGTNTVQYFLDAGQTVLNLDRQPPLDANHATVWRKTDLLDAAGLLAAFADFHPDAVIHLAARAECDETTTVEEGYRDNTVGTQNVLDAIKATPGIQRAIITSSQFVCGPGYAPKHDLDFHPVTVYGQSKVITEKLTRDVRLPCTWTIVRPTNIWGPWHQRYMREFWRIAARGLYVHPAGRPVVRCYGYIGNLVRYLERILRAEPATVHEQVFYLSDPANDIYAWANAFCLGLHGKPARRVPRPVLWILGQIGDLISLVIRKPFYITSSRYRSMTSDYLVPGAIEKTIAALGPPPIPLDEGVRQTVEWLHSHGFSIPSQTPGK